MDAKDWTLEMATNLWQLLCQTEGIARVGPVDLDNNGEAGIRVTVVPSEYFGDPAVRPELTDAADVTYEVRVRTSSVVAANDASKGGKNAQ